MLDRRLVFWTLYGVMALALPVVFFMVQLAATVPLVAIVFAIPRWQIFALVHLALYIPIFWGLAALLRRLVFARPGQLWSRTVYCLLIGGLLSIAFVAPYGIGGHGEPANYTWVKALGAL